MDFAPKGNRELQNTERQEIITDLERYAHYLTQLHRKLPIDDFLNGIRDLKQKDNTIEFVAQTRLTVRFLLDATKDLADKHHFDHFYHEVNYVGVLRLHHFVSDELAGYVRSVIHDSQ